MAKNKIKIYYSILVFLLCISFAVPYYKTFININGTMKIIENEKQEFSESTIGLNLLLEQIQHQQEKFLDINIDTLISSWNKMHEGEIKIFGFDVDGNESITLGGIDYWFADNKLIKIEINSHYTLNNLDQQEGLNTNILKMQKLPLKHLAYEGGPRILIGFLFFIFVVVGLIFLLKYEFGGYRQLPINIAQIIFLTVTILIGISFYFMIISSLFQIADDVFAVYSVRPWIFISGFQESFVYFTFLFQLLIVDVILLLVSIFRRRKLNAYLLQKGESQGKTVFQKKEQKNVI